MMTEGQRFLLDTFGYFIVADAITSAQVAALKATLHHPTEQWEPLDKAEGPLHWDVIWRDLLDLPGLSPILEELIGDPALKLSIPEYDIQLVDCRADVCTAELATGNAAFRELYRFRQHQGYKAG